jgi:hypothetical protein
VVASPLTKCYTTKGILSEMSKVGEKSTIIQDWSLQAIRGQYIYLFLSCAATLPVPIPHAMLQHCRLQPSTGSAPSRAGIAFLSILHCHCDSLIWDHYPVPSESVLCDSALGLVRSLLVRTGPVHVLLADPAHYSVLLVCFFFY